MRQSEHPLASPGARRAVWVLAAAGYNFSLLLPGSRTLAQPGSSVQCYLSGQLMYRARMIRLTRDGCRSGGAPDFVEVGEAGIAVDDAMRRQRHVQLVG